jgi:hypothetical protein
MCKAAFGFREGLIMKKLSLPCCVLLAALSAVVWGLVGCETGDGTAALTVTPTEVFLVGATNTVRLTVGSAGGTNTTAGLRSRSLPLEWRVTNPALGQILESSGFVAIYVRSPQNGINTVTVKDQYDAEGFAVIHQR